MFLLTIHQRIDGIKELWAVGRSVFTANRFRTFPRKAVWLPNAIDPLFQVFVSLFQLFSFLITLIFF